MVWCIGILKNQKCMKHLRGLLISVFLVWMYILFNLYNLQQPYNEENELEEIFRSEPAATLHADTSTALLEQHFKDSKLMTSGCGESKDVQCLNKIKWMTEMWKSDKCYAVYGVDGSICSIRYYLSMIEGWCEPMPSFKPFNFDHNETTSIAMFNANLTSLTDLMTLSNYDWMVTRIKRMWKAWVASLEKLEAVKSKLRKKRRILIYLGLLSKKSNFKLQESAGKGGPLGELVQWSDILSSLHLLGHHLTIISEYDDLTRKLNKLPDARSQCQNLRAIPYDFIITDITGLTHFKKIVNKGYSKFRCKLWIIDSFGTEAYFNHPTFEAKNRKLRSSWGKHSLNLKQFFTMFPHSPDNSFMGFVVEQLYMGSIQKDKEHQALVYGKSEFMWNGKESYLERISKHIEIHATVFVEKQKSILPSFVVNHGILNGAELQRLLLKSKLFIGLGFPYEGPAPLEAIAAGCVFINPSFNPPHNLENTKFFAGKPTKRGLTSQHPYAEDFISFPNVITVDISDLNAVEKAVETALKLLENGTVRGYLPREYTHAGMLERVNAYLEHQNFCDRQTIWPPPDLMKVVESKVNQSCKQACWSKKLLCEPAYFKLLNEDEVLDKYFKCEKHTIKMDLHYPAFDTSNNNCVQQADPLLFSCVDSGLDMIRLCPCRTFIPDQVALCRECI